MVPHLDKKFRRTAQSQMRFKQFAKTSYRAGLKRGQVFNFDKRGRLNEAGGAVGEDERVKKTFFPVDQGTLTVGEFGNAIELTEFLEDTAELSMRTEGMDELRADAARVKDVQIEAEMDYCANRFTPTTGSTGDLVTTGTATATASSALKAVHVRTIIDELRRNNAPATRGGDYWGILTIQAHQGIYTDIEAITVYTTLDNAAKGEAGKYYQCRMVTETNAMSESIGTAAALCGEAYFFGKDGTVYEGVVHPLHLAYEDEDFGRIQYIAWLETVGYRLIWRSGDSITQVRTIKVDSA